MSDADWEVYWTEASIRAAEVGTRHKPDDRVVPHVSMSAEAVSVDRCPFMLHVGCGDLSQRKVKNVKVDIEHNDNDEGSMMVYFRPCYARIS